MTDITNATINESTREAAGKIILAGGTGFLGSMLIRHWVRRGHEIVILSRGTRQSTGIRTVRWDGRETGAWAAELNGALAVVNLAGKSVNCRYTNANRAEIIASRVNSVNALAQAIRDCERPPRVWIQAASLAIYGDSGDRVIDERDALGTGFSADVCKQWEATVSEARTLLTRKVILRIGFALGREGGALAPLVRLARWSLGGTIGSGRQYVSWLHLEDLSGIFDWCLNRDECEGTYNATGPVPVSNEEFMRELRRAVRRPWSPRTPAWAVRFGSRLMGTEAELALHGRRCIPKRLNDEGFRFAYPRLADALNELLRRKH